MKTLMATLILLASTTFAQAGVIFADDFNRPDNADVLNNWNEFHNDATSIANGKLKIVGGGAPLGPLVGHGLITAGLDNIKLSFDLSDVVAAAGVKRLSLRRGFLFDGLAVEGAVEGS